MDKDTKPPTNLTHFNAEGEANMVDVGGKAITQRVAVAEGIVRMQPATLAQILSGDSHKGDVLGIARIAGIMAAKKTADLIPLCHPLALNKVKINFDIDKENNQVCCQSTVKVSGKTGVEMEALTAVQISLLTIYDMCKAIDRGMTITQVRVVKKSGGKSGDWTYSK